MKTKSEKQGEPSQMMIIMDEMFRSERGATYDDIICAYCDRRNYEEKLRKAKYDILKRVVGKAKCLLAKRIKNYGAEILGEKVYNDPNDKRYYHTFFRYSEDIGDFDPIEDLRYKFKKIKLSELSELLVQSAGLFPKSWLVNFKTQVDEFNENVIAEEQISKVLYFDNNEKLKNIEILPTLVEMIKKRQVIRFRYHPFDKLPYYVTVHPQILKEYNLRWFLFGLAPDKEGHLRDQQFALDRIDKTITTCQNIPYIKSGTNFEQYFSERVGVSGQRVKTFDVEILIEDIKTLEYIRTKPIHHSQKIEGNKVYYHVKDNYEFVTRLFEFADKITIVKPKELKDNIINRANDILNKHRG
jgi:hypothetical protein